MQLLSRINNLINNNRVVLILGAITSLVGWDGNYDGGDIAASRRSFLGESPIDIWGSFSGFFYGAIPNKPISWGMYLYMLQIIMTVIALVIIQNSLLLQKNIFRKIGFYIFSYLMLCFATTLTRDATLSVLLIFGVSIILRNPRLCRENIFSFSLAIFFISLGLALRPWLSLVTILILFIITSSDSNKKLLIAFSLISLAAPFILNSIPSQIFGIKSVHPELQVLIMDGGSIACLSSYQDSRDEARQFLNNFNKDSFSSDELCANFRLNTWTTLGVWQPTLEELNIDYVPKRDPNDLRNPLIKIYTNLPKEKYEEIRTNWIKLIANNPKEYIRVKLLHLNQLLILGDTSQLRFKKLIDTSFQNSVFFVIKAMLFMPWDLMVYFHLLAPLPTILFFSFIIMFRERQKTVINLATNNMLILPYSFMGCYLIITTIAYIGDTGRYMYLPSILFWLFILSRFKKQTYEK